MFVVATLGEVGVRENGGTGFQIWVRNKGLT